MKRVFRIVPALLALPSLLPAQGLSQRVAAMGDGTIRVSFASRPGVCGNGANSITVVDDNDEWEGQCERGPVRVSLRVKGGKVAEANTYVGGHWRSQGAPATDIGTLPAAAAAAELLTLAEASPEGGDALITAATLADSTVIWPRLLEIARKESAPAETRRQAIFWLGQAAGKAATKGLDSIAGDDRGDIELRKQAVFALSQRPAEEGVPVLIQIARSNRYPEIRESALFWLGQSNDPRALALFDELLR